MTKPSSITDVKTQNVLTTTTASKTQVTGSNANLQGDTTLKGLIFGRPADETAPKHQVTAGNANGLQGAIRMEQYKWGSGNSNFQGAA